MKIVFFGASDLGYRCCQLILEKKLAEVTGIFTIPRNFKISYSEEPVNNVMYRDFHVLGKEFDIPIINVTDKMNQYKEQLSDFNPDLLLAIGWYYMIPSALRESAPLGCVGIHASLLPKYRGGAPLVWAIINGETETGVSLFHFGDGVDDGDIIGQEKFHIEKQDTIKEVILKATEASLCLIEKNIPMIADDTASRIPQNHSDATYVPQRRPEDGLIDWSWDSTKVYNFIRAQTRPYPGAYTIINNKKVLIWDADILDN